MISLRGHSVVTTYATPQTLAYPAGLRAGWLLVVAVVTKGTVPTPTGWQLIPTDPVQPVDVNLAACPPAIMRLYVFSKFVTVADIDAGQVTVVPTSAAIAACMTFSGVHQTNPFAAVGRNATTPANVTCSVPGIPVLYNDTLMLMVTGHDKGVVVTKHASTTELFQKRVGTTSTTLQVSTEQLSEPQTTGTRDVTVDSGCHHVELSVALNPAPEPGAADADPDARDLYKSIILRRSTPSNYKKDRDSGLAKLFAIVGESDNNIGGLFGKANFLMPTTEQLYAEVSLVGVESDSATGTDTILITMPVGTADDDVLLAHVTKRSDTGSSAITAPVGWTELRQDNITVAEDLVHAVFYRVASGEAGPYAFEWDEADADAGAAVSVYRGVDTANPIMDDNVMTQVASDVIQIMEGVTVTVPTLVVGGCAVSDSDPGDFTTPPRMALLADTSDGLLAALGLFYEAVAIGDTGYRAAMSDPAPDGLTHLLALNPRAYP